jgi:hypothetical protein
MQTAGARVLPEGDKQGEMSREAVLLQWERKIEEAERRPGRFDRADEDLETDSGSRRVRLAAVPNGDNPPQERRTVTITGRPGPTRRRRSVVENQLAQPDRIALWAFLLGLFLVAVAAGTAHA